MSSTIHFQSRYHGARLAHGAGGRLRSRGADIDTLRPTISTDDARDIAWRQSYKSDTLVTKSRIDEAHISILLCGIRTPEWSISLRTNDDKNNFYAQCDLESRMSASLSHHVYESHIYDTPLSDVTDMLLTKEQRHSLIIYVTSELDREAYKNIPLLAEQNDIIVIHLFHPFELHPEKYKNLLITSKLLDSSAYLREFNAQKSAIQSYLREHGIGYISAHTLEHPTLLLNQYFKHHYAR